MKRSSTSCNQHLPWQSRWHYSAYIFPYMRNGYRSLGRRKTFEYPTITNRRVPSKLHEPLASNAKRRKEPCSKAQPNRDLPSCTYGESDPPYHNGEHNTPHLLHREKGQCPHSRAFPLARRASSRENRKTGHPATLSLVSILSKTPPLQIDSKLNACYLCVPPLQFSHTGDQGKCYLHRPPQGYYLEGISIPLINTLIRPPRLRRFLSPAR